MGIVFSSRLAVLAARSTGLCGQTGIFIHPTGLAVKSMAGKRAISPSWI